MSMLYYYCYLWEKTKERNIGEKESILGGDPKKKVRDIAVTKFNPTPILISHRSNTSAQTVHTKEVSNIIINGQLGS